MGLGKSSIIPDMSGAVRQSIEALKKAQGVDRELYVTQQRLQQIPEDRAKMKRALELEKLRLQELEASRKKLQLTQKQKEGELSQKEANIKKLDGQLSQIKTNREYTAMQQEISSLKADNSLLEEEVIRILDEVEAAEEEVRKEKDRLKQIEKDYQVREAELTQKEKALQETLERLKKSRNEVILQVPPDVRGLYDTIVQKKQGVGLVKVNGEICGACQLQLRPQLLNEIRLGQAIVVCENCSRILYYEE